MTEPGQPMRSERAHDSTPVFAGLGALVLVFFLVPLFVADERWVAAIRQVVYATPAALAAIVSIRVAVRVHAEERALWLGIAAGAIGFFVGVVWASPEVISGVVPPWPWVSVASTLFGIAALTVTVFRASGFRTSSWVVNVRHVLDLVASSLIVYGALFAFVFRPLGERYPDVVHPGVVVLGPLFPVLGVALFAGVLVNHAGAKLRRRPRWEGALAGGLGVAAWAYILWPLWFYAAVLVPRAPWDTVVQVLAMAGAYHLFYAGLLRRSSRRHGRELHGLPRMRPRSHVVPGIVVPIVYVALVPWLIHAALTSPSGSIESGVLFGLGVGFTIVVAGRSALTAVENSHLFRRSVSDPVTELLGHRYFHERLAVELELAERHGEELGVVAVDVDDFSRVNAACGHAGGDELLRAIAAQLAEACRSTDSVCRLGGDEFGIILPDTSEPGALEVCQRLRDRLRIVRAPDGREVTVSVGVSLYPRDGAEVSTLLRKADGAQYWAKYHGKDAVILYDSRVVEAMNAEERIRNLEEQSQLATVRSLAAAVDARDNATQYHSRNVASLAVRLAEALSLDEDTVRLLEVAALLHDVGKIGVADAILRKRGPLTAAERRHIQEHPILGEKILASTRLDEILPWVRWHHERWDGKGYPDGLEGEAIPLEARILALCDAYDAMTSTRPYRAALSHSAAIQELDLCIGTQFDPTLTEVFIRLVGTTRGDHSLSLKH